MSQKSPQKSESKLEERKPEGETFVPDEDTLDLLAMIMQRLKIVERNIGIQNENYKTIQTEREEKLTRINSDISTLYQDYQDHLTKQAA